MVVPSDPSPYRSRDCRAKLGMIIAPEHLVVARGAIEKQLAPLGEVKQAAPDEEIVARSGLVPAERILERRFVNRTERRDTSNRSTNLLQQSRRVAFFKGVQTRLHGSCDFGA